MPINALWAAEGDNIEVIFANNDMMALGAVAAINGYGYNTPATRAIPPSWSSALTPSTRRWSPSRTAA